MARTTKAIDAPMQFAQRWCATLVPDKAGGTVHVDCRKQGWGALQMGRSFAGLPLKIGTQVFDHGLATHADSEILLRASADAKRFQATVGVDFSPHTAGPAAERVRIVFSVEVAGKELWRSPEMNRTSAPQKVDLALPAGTREIVLRAMAADGNLAFAHADWAEARVTLAGGKLVRLGETGWGAQPGPSPAPFSFTYGGRGSAELLPQWQVQRESRRAGRGVTEHKVTWRDEHTGLECRLEMKQFAGFPAVEWVVYFRNTGSTDSPILEDIQGLDVSWRLSPDTNALRPARVYHSRGSVCSIADFEYLEHSLAATPLFSVTGAGGRSSNDWLPFFNLENGELGVLTAIGWTGQWACQFKVEQGLVRARAGMEKTHLKLLPGEQIRSPRILQLFWEKDRLAGHNLLRRFLLAHHVPRHKGKPVTGPLTMAHWGGMKTQGHLDRLAVYKEQRLPHDYYWVDAGWYGHQSTYSPDEFSGDWAQHTGDWRINPKAHPQGLKPVSAAARDAGMRFMLWVEPERAIQGTHWTLEHPEWFLGTRDAGANLLLDLGNPKALAGVIEAVCTLIKENRVGCYRQDFNMDPLPFWRQNDAPDRQGITEIRHVEGLYAFWDALLERFPGLIIDNCSSGGRRIDLETISRSIPQWRSDWQCSPTNDPIGGQTHGMGLSYWIPLHGTGTYNSMPTRATCSTYRFRSAMGPTLMFGAFPYESTPVDLKYPWDWYRKMARDYVRARPLYTGDYYPLTEASADPRNWAAYQMNRPDLGEGFVLALRRNESPWSAAQFALRGLDAQSQYVVEDADTGRKRRLSGQALMEQGVEVKLPEVDGSMLVFYRRIGR